MRSMDDVTTRPAPTDTTDLAAIVLGTDRARERHLGAPERVPAWHEPTPTSGFDARSVAVLGLVVAVFAGIIGWVTTIDDAPPAPTTPKVATRASDAAPGPAAGDVKPAAAAVSGDTALAPGIDLVPGRLTMSRSGSGSGLVELSVRNAGATDLAAGSATALLVVDGDVVGTEPLGALASGASTRLEVSMGWCPSGALPVVAVLDPGSVVRESNERNNSISRRAAFGC